MDATNLLVKNYFMWHRYDMPKTISPRERIKQLEAELAAARARGRTKREPIIGFGGAVQRKREELGMGVRELATRAKTNPSNISRIEQRTDANPTLSIMQAIADGLGVDLASLLEA